MGVRIEEMGLWLGDGGLWGGVVLYFCARSWLNGIDENNF